MELKTVELYQYSELSDIAKEKAREWFLKGAFDYNWYEFTYEDAETIGLKITSFDTYYNTIGGEWIESPYKVIELIKKNHGEQCETYKTALQYESEFSKLGEDEDGNQIEDENIEDDFRRALLEDYLIMLRKEVEYMESEEAISEAMEANEYTFLDNGTRFG